MWTSTKLQNKIGIKGVGARYVRDEFKKNHLPKWADKYPKSIIDTASEDFGKSLKSTKGKTPEYRSKYKTKRSFRLYRKDQYSIRIKGKRWDFCGFSIKMSEELRFDGVIKTLTLEITNDDEYYICVAVDLFEEPEKVEVSTETVGLDWGLKTYFTASDGTEYTLPDFSEEENKVRRAQAARDRKKDKKSKSYKKADAYYKRLLKNLRNKKEDAWKKMVHEIASTHSHIGIETLSFSEMVKNASKMREPKSFRRKLLSYPNYLIRETLKTKAFEIIEIGKFEATSQVCSCCGQIHKEMKNLSNRTLVCDCGLSMDRDLNAAINIRKLAFLNNKN